MTDVVNGWTPSTLKIYVDQRFDDMNARVSAALTAQQTALDKLNVEVTQRFDGVDKNLDRVIATVGERTGGIQLVQRIVPNLIAIASIVAIILVAKGK